MTDEFMELQKQIDNLCRALSMLNERVVRLEHPPSNDTYQQWLEANYPEHVKEIDERVKRAADTFIKTSEELNW